jgi:hypothetical protein
MAIGTYVAYGHGERKSIIALIDFRSGKRA